MKKLLFVLSATLFAASSFAQEFSFSNEVSTDVFHMTHIDDLQKPMEEDDTDFAGIYDEVTVDFSSEKLDFGFNSKFGIDDFDDDANFDEKRIHEDPSDGVYAIAMDDFDYYVEFRPIDVLALGLSMDYETAGAYLPVWDDTIEAGKLGSDGLSLVVKPVQGLRIVGTIPFNFDFVNTLNGSKDDGYNKFYFGAGVDYTMENVFTAGINIDDIADSDFRQIGLFASLTAVENLVLNAGLTIATEDNPASIDFDFWGFELLGETLITAGASYELEALSLAADFAVNTDSEKSDYDLYTGVNVGYQINEQLGLAVKGVLGLDLGAPEGQDEADTLFGVEPSVSFALNENNEFSAGVDVEIVGSNRYIAIPLSWVYKF